MASDSRGAIPLLVLRSAGVFLFLLWYTAAGVIVIAEGSRQTKPPSILPRFMLIPFHSFLIPYSPRKSQSHGAPRTELILWDKTPPNRVTAFSIHRVDQLAKQHLLLCCVRYTSARVRIFNQSCVCRYVLVHDPGHHQVPGRRGTKIFRFMDRHRILLGFSRLTSHTITLNWMASWEGWHIGIQNQNPRPISVENFPSLAEITRHHFARCQAFFLQVGGSSSS